MKTRNPKSHSETRVLDGKEIVITDDELSTADLISVLTAEERRFVEAYCGSTDGSLIAATIEAGLVNADELAIAPIIGLEYLRRPAIKQLIRRREMVLDFERDGILGPKELKKFWSEIITGDFEIPHKLSASKLLADAHGLNLQRQRIEQKTEQKNTIEIIWTGPGSSVDDQNTIDLKQGDFTIQPTGEEQDPLLDDIPLF